MRALKIKTGEICKGCKATAEEEWRNLDLGLEVEDGHVAGGSGNGDGRLETRWEVVGNETCW